MMSVKRTDVFDIKLDPDEQIIEDALPETWEALPFTENMEEERGLAKEAASNYLRKDAKINIRLSRFDIEGLRRIAAKEGLLYQTLISSVLHKYVSSYLQPDYGDWFKPKNHRGGRR